MKGIDISYWQAVLDWKTLKDVDSIEFAYIKASEGTGRTEPRALEQATNAKAIGIKIGYYHYCHVENDAAAEAEHFKKVLSGLPAADLLPVMDLEANKPNLSAEDVTAWVAKFCVYFGDKLMFYSYTPFINQYTIKSKMPDMPLWLAQYSKDGAKPVLPINWTAYKVWQWTGSGKVIGYNGDIDCNVCDELPLINVT